ncbi:MAG: DMT family transporter [Rubrivivax sp.]|nr:DMT family transporter [Rubrivivax sp.]
MPDGMTPDQAGPQRACATQTLSGDSEASRRAALHHANRHGIELMLLSMACFMVNDTLVKIVSQSLPTGQLIFLRGAMATLFVLAIMRATGVPVAPRQLMQGVVPLRSAIDAMATLAYLGSLFHLPIANATAINMATPLVITLLAVVWLRERITRGHALAVTLGFIGVLLVIQPRADGLNSWAWLCLLGTLLHAVRDFLTQRVPREVPSIAVTLATAIGVTGAAGALSLLQGWQPLGAVQLGMLAAAAVFLSGGYQFLIRAMRSGQIAVVAPFRYSGLLMAVALGWLVWGELPNALAWCGIALVVAAGLYLMRRRHA